LCQWHLNAILILLEYKVNHDNEIVNLVNKSNAHIT